MGRITATAGSVIDFEYIEADLIDLCSRFDVKEIPYDPWQATQLATRMIDRGLPMVEIRASVQNFSEPMKNLEALTLQGKLLHDGDPVLTWMVSNVVAHLDAKDNIYPRKERPENKIDGVVALIMALNRAQINAGEFLDVSDFINSPIIG
jgi:phage terminase large subunit-like protein